MVQLTWGQTLKFIDGPILEYSQRFQVATDHAMEDHYTGGFCKCPDCVAVREAGYRMNILGQLRQVYGVQAQPPSPLANYYSDYRGAPVRDVNGRWIIDDGLTCGRLAPW
jgi:hypothetical protein